MLLATQTHDKEVLQNDLRLKRLQYNRTHSLSEWQDPFFQSLIFSSAPRYLRQHRTACPHVASLYIAHLDPICSGIKNGSALLTFVYGKASLHRRLHTGRADESKGAGGL